MKAQEFVKNFSLATSDNPKDGAFIVDDDVINDFTYDSRLAPMFIDVNVVDDSTIEARWISFLWSDDIESLVEEISRYSNKIAQKANLEEDVILILNIRSSNSVLMKNIVDNDRSVGLTDLGQENLDQNFRTKIIIKAHPKKNN